MEREKLFEVIRHYDDMEAFIRGVTEKIKEKVKEKNNAILTVILFFIATADKQKMSTRDGQKKINETEEKIKEIVDDLGDELLSKIKQECEKTFDTELAFLILLLAFLGRNHKSISQNEKNKIIKYENFSGVSIRRRIDKFKSDFVYNILKLATDSLNKNMEINQIKYNLNRLMDAAGNSAKIEADTILNSTINDTALSVAAKNKTNLMYIAIMDMNVCHDCRHLHGVIFAYDDTDIPVLPQHPRCRCQLVPVINGLDKISFKEYFESLSENEKKNRIGSARYAEYKKGQYKIKEYVYPEKSVSIGEIKKTDKIHFS